VKAALLDDEFRPLSVRPGSELLLLEGDVALRLVNRAADEGVPIVGVDGYPAGDLETDVAEEDAVDFSREVGEGRGCWERAEAFIRDRAGKGLVFEVLLGDDPVEGV
jgi:hypothetical protein